MKTYHRILYGLNALGAAWIFILMLLVCAEIASRFFLNTPIRGVAEISGLSVIAITFLQLPIVVHSKRLARADMLIERLHKYSPRLAQSLEFIFSLMGALIFAAIIWSSANGLIQSWLTEDQFGAQGTFTFTKWPLWLIVLVCSCCVFISFLMQALEGHSLPKSELTKDTYGS